jgi:hypothetical protein
MRTREWLARLIEINQMLVSFKARGGEIKKLSPYDGTIPRGDFNERFIRKNKPWVKGRSDYNQNNKS